MDLDPRKPNGCNGPAVESAVGETAPSFLDLQAISKTYPARDGRPVRALDEITCTIRNGEFASILGPSGCGKSTLLLIIAGLISPTSGKLRFREEKVRGGAPDFGIVFQDPVLFPWRDVQTNVELPAEVAGIRREQRAETARKLIALVGLQGFEQKYPYELSGGMQQRVAIARALVLSPSLLLMDEPFGALDAMTREQMNLELQKISMATRATVVFVTHSIAEAVFLSDRVMVMTGRPAILKDVVEIDIPRPRNLEMIASGRFGGLVSRLRQLLDFDGGSSVSVPTGPEAEIAVAATGERAGGVLRDRLGQVVGLVVFLALWEGKLRLFDVPQFILPTPIEIIQRIVKDAVTGLIFVHVQVTVLETLFGFLLAAILGVGLGCAVGLSLRFERIVYPYILALQTIPKVAVAPLMIIWVGYGIQSKILTAGLIAFFPILVNVVVGLKTVEPRMLLLMRALKAGHLQTFIKVRLPSMLPYLFAGLETAIIFAVIGAIVGEFIGASQGLGSLIIQRQAAIDVPGVFSVLFYLSAIGIVLDAVLRAIARRYAFWSHRASASEQSN